METKVLGTTAVKGKKGNFVVTTVTEMKEVIDIKALKTTASEFEKAMKVYEELMQSFQASIDILSKNKESEKALKFIIQTFDGARSEYTDRKNQLQRMNELIDLIKKTK